MPNACLQADDAPAAVLAVGFTDNAVELFSFAIDTGGAALASEAPTVLVPTLRVCCPQATS